MFIAYLASFLDRVSITYASIGGLDKALNLTSATFGFLSGAFFLTYFLCEIPSNLLLNKFGARKWIARILVSWGLVTFFTAWVNNAASLMLFRFLLGMAEAGFFPGMLLFIGYWFPNKQRARIVALFMTAPPIANALGSPAATWVVGHNWLGFPGWRWIFIFAGIPAVIIGIITFFYLTDRPQQAKWLSDAEKEWLTGVLAREEAEKRAERLAARGNKVPIKAVFKNRTVWQFTFINFTYVIGLYGITFWMPRIVNTFSKGLTAMQTGLVTMLPYFCGAIVMVLVARHSDMTQERKYHAALMPFIGAIGLGVASLSHNSTLSIVMLCIATAGLYSFSAPYWALSSSFITAEVAVVGFGIVNCVGNLGGFVGPYLVGLIDDVSGNLVASVIFLAIMLGLTCVQVLIVSGCRKETKEANLKAAEVR